MSQLLVNQRSMQITKEGRNHSGESQRCWLLSQLIEETVGFAQPAEGDAAKKKSQISGTS